MANIMGVVCDRALTVKCLLVCNCVLLNVAVILESLFAENSFMTNFQSQIFTTYSMITHRTSGPTHDSFARFERLRSLTGETLERASLNYRFDSLTLMASYPIAMLLCSLVESYGILIGIGKLESTVTVHTTSL